MGHAKEKEAREETQMQGRRDNDRAKSQGTGFGADLEGGGRLCGGQVWRHPQLASLSVSSAEKMLRVGLGLGEGEEVCHSLQRIREGLTREWWPG